MADYSLAEVTIKNVDNNEAQQANDRPSFSLRQSSPQRIGSNFELNQFPPEHAVRYDSVPLLCHKLGSAKRLGIEVR